MSQSTIEQLPKTTVKFTITVTEEEMKPALELAANRISERLSIPGFRPGKAPYSIVKEHVSEMQIYEEALESIIRKSIAEAVKTHNIETVGSPKIDVEKLAPGNDFVFTAEMNRMPQALKLADWKKVCVKAQATKVEPKDVESILHDLQKMQTKEIRTDAATPAGEKSKVVIAVDMKKDNVPVEGGQSPNHHVYLNEEYFIPGFKEQIIGMKEGETKNFTLNFPAEHTNKLLAGNPVDFVITVKEHYNLEHPSLDDVFAQSLGQKSIKDLEGVIEKNVQTERDLQEKLRQEKETLETIAKESTFEEIPDLLVNEELNRMLQELRRNVEEKGGKFEDYLKSIKKSLAEVKLDLTADALTRIKVAIILDTLSKSENIEIDEETLKQKIAEQQKHARNEEEKEFMKTQDYANYFKHVLKNRKMIDLILATCVQKTN